jgi:DNA helicase II / ATP-dependent DNA helicase PcrA
MNPTIEQQQFFDEVAFGSGNVLLSAKAGSGKTSTLVEAVKLIPKNKSTLACAFNVSIKDELTQRMSGIDIKTCHGLGFSLLRGSQMNTKKMAEIYNFLLKEEASWLKSQEGFAEMLWDMKKFTDLCRLNLVETAEDFTNCQNKYGYRFTNDELQVIRRAIELADGDIKNIDFVDQIRQPIVRNLNPIFKYVNLFIDESQDLSKAQRVLISKFLAPGGRMYFVGDRSQSIYGFSGADSESFDTLASMCKVMSLNTCFRCSKEVIKHVNKIDPDIKAWEHAKEGLVRGGTTLDNIKAGDAVLCRNNAPLIEGCYDMIAKGKKATIMGRDIGESLINFIVSFKSNSLSDLQRRMNEKRQQLIDRLEDKFPSEDAYSNPLYTKFSEQMECVTVLIFKVGTIASVDNLTTYIRRIFSDDKKPEILFSTVHRAKGLEWPNVYIIEPSLLTKRRPKDKDWQHEQATNLEYVAYTRAKETLNFVVKPKKH